MGSEGEFYLTEIVDGVQTIETQYSGLTEQTLTQAAVVEKQLTSLFSKADDSEKQIVTLSLKADKSEQQIATLTSRIEDNSSRAIENIFVDTPIYDIVENKTQILINNLNNLNNLNKQFYKSYAQAVFYALKKNNGYLYIGGNFISSDTKILNFILKYDSENNTITNLGSGLGGPCNRIVFDSNNNLYAAGSFRIAGNINCKNIAKWNGVNWSALGSGINPTGTINGYTIVIESCVGLDIHNNILYTATNYNVLVSNNIVIYYGINAFDIATSTWSQISFDVGNVNLIKIDSVNNILFIGGSFTTAGGVNCLNVAALNISTLTWSPLGSGISMTNTAPIGGGSCNALEIVNNILYVGGSFLYAGGVSRSYIAKWNILTSTWSSIGSGANLNQCLSIKFDSTDSIYIGGIFTSINGVAGTYYIAKYNVITAAWSTVSTFNLTSPCNRIAIEDGIIYVASRNNLSTLSYFSSSNNLNFSSLNAGYSISTLIDTSNNDIYAGGFFTSVEGITGNCIIKYDGTDLSALGSGLGVTGGLCVTMEYYNSYLYAGGSFYGAISKWDGATWVSLSGVNGSCNILKYYNGYLYAGGVAIPGVTGATGIAKWDGTNWTALGTGLTSGGTFYSFAFSDNILYAAGFFTTVGGVTCANIAKWNIATSTWSPLGTGLNGICQSIKIKDGILYAGGNFTTAGGISCNYIAKWNIATSTWSALGTGLNTFCNTIEIDGNTLYAGGYNIYNNSSVAEWNIESSYWSIFDSSLTERCFYIQKDPVNNILLISIGNSVVAYDDKIIIRYKNNKICDLKKDVSLLVSMQNNSLVVSENKLLFKQL